MHQSRLDQLEVRMRLLVVLGLLSFPAIAEPRDPFSPFERAAPEADLPPIQRVPVEALKCTSNTWPFWPGVYAA